MSKIDEILEIVRSNAVSNAVRREDKKSCSVVFVLAVIGAIAAVAAIAYAVYRYFQKNEIEELEEDFDEDFDDDFFEDEDTEPIVIPRQEGEEEDTKNVSAEE